MTSDEDISKLVPIQQLTGDDERDTSLLQGMAAEAERFLQSFEWCRATRKGWFGWGIGGVVGVFLWELEASSENADTRLWVIVGDVPPAYLVTDQSPAPLLALNAYVDLVQDWVDAVRSGRPTDDCIPVNVAPTLEWANALQRRLDFIREKILDRASLT